MVDYFPFSFGSSVAPSSSCSSMLRLDLERCPYVVADSSRSLALSTRLGRWLLEAIGCLLLGLHSRRRNHLRPLGDFVVEELARFAGRVADRFDADGLETALDVSRGDCLGGFGRDPGDDVARRSGRREE